MTSTKISALTDGVTLNATDRIPVARSPFATSDNRYVTGTQIATFIGAREKITADRTYYVRTDGSNSNTGLANTAGGAWATPQYAYDWIVENIDFNNNHVIVQLADGTYSVSAAGTNDGVLVCFQEWLGGGSLTFQGNTGDRSAVVFEQLTNQGIVCEIGLYASGIIHLKYLTLKQFNNGDYNNFECIGNTPVFLENVNFQGGQNGYNIQCDFTGYLYVRGTYSCLSDNNGHINVKGGGTVEYNANIVAPSPVNCNGAWFSADRFGAVNIIALNKTGTFTGFTAYAGAQGWVSAVGKTMAQLPGDGTYLGEYDGLVVTQDIFSSEARPTAIRCTGYVKSLSTTVASLPSAATAGSGARAFVTNATATTFLSVVAGGGSNKVPVVSDGTNWLIG